MRRTTLSLLALTALLAACASPAAPEDVQMSNSLCNQGKQLLAGGKAGDARDVFASAANRNDNNARAWNGLGASYELLGKKTDAEDAYRRASDLAPDDAAIANNLAHLYLATNRASDAVAILQPFIDKGKAPTILKQNYAQSLKAAQASRDVVEERYADIGSFPTEGMAKGHAAEARRILDDKSVTFTVAPDMKTIGGIPTFTVKVTGRSPQSICDDLNSEAIPCVPHGN